MLHELQVKATRDIEEGEELTFSYGERSSTDFLVHYGFVPLRNPRDDVVLFEDVDAALDWYALESGLPLLMGREDEEALIAALQQLGARRRAFVWRCLAARGWRGHSRVWCMETVALKGRQSLLAVRMQLCRAKTLVAVEHSNIARAG